MNLLPWKRETIRTYDASFWLALINPKKLKVSTWNPLTDSESKCISESTFNSLMRMKMLTKTRVTSHYSVKQGWGFPIPHCEYGITSCPSSHCLRFMLASPTQMLSFRDQAGDLGRWWGGGLCGNWRLTGLQEHSRPKYFRTLYRQNKVWGGGSKPQQCRPMMWMGSVMTQTADGHRVPRYLPFRCVLKPKKQMNTFFFFQLQTFIL